MNDNPIILSHAAVIWESAIWESEIDEGDFPRAPSRQLGLLHCRWRYDNIRIYTNSASSYGGASEIMLSEIPAQQYAAALDACAEEVLAEARLDGPPVDALALAARMGMVTVVDQQMPGRARFVRLAQAGGQGTILIGPEPRRERRHWAVAHEIGETVAHRVFSALGVSPSDAAPATREAVANALAGRLLLPEAWFAADARDCDYDLTALKARYSTASHELVARRMLELSAPAIMTVFDHGRICRAGRRASHRRRRAFGKPCIVADARSSSATSDARYGAGRYTKRTGGARFCGRTLMKTFRRRRSHARRTRCLRPVRPRLRLAVTQPARAMTIDRRARHRA